MYVEAASMWFDPFPVTNPNQTHKKTTHHTKSKDRMKSVAALLLTLCATSSAIELTPDNWDEVTAGKTVFLKMFAPWCGHCKKMKPDWDKLMEEFKDSPTALVADVVCKC